MDQRRVDDIGMPDHPTDIAGGPEHVVGLDAVDVRHRPGERHRVATIVAHHALRNPGRARSVEDVERVGRQHRHAIEGGRRGFQLAPVMFPAGDELRFAHRPLQYDAGFGLGRRLRDRRVEQWLVGDDAVDLDPARRQDDDARFGVVDTGRQLVRGEPTEHHRMHRADPRAGEHCDRRLGHHRHVDQHPVALHHTEPGQRPGEARDAVAQLAIGERGDGVGDGAS